MRWWRCLCLFVGTRRVSHSLVECGCAVFHHLQACSLDAKHLGDFDARDAFISLMGCPPFSRRAVRAVNVRAESPECLPTDTDGNGTVYLVAAAADALLSHASCDGALNAEQRSSISSRLARCRPRNEPLSRAGSAPELQVDSEARFS